MELMPIYTSDNKIKADRKQKYIKELEKSYPNLTKMTELEYKEIRLKLEKYKANEVFEELKEKSLYHVIEAVSSIYAQYDIEDKLPIEDALSHSIFSLYSILNKFETLPTSYSKYSHSIINYISYITIFREWNVENSRLEKLDFKTEDEIAYIVDDIDQEYISNYDLNKYEFEKAMMKAGKKLSTREIEILNLRFGFLTGKAVRSTEIAKIYNVSISRINEILGKALKKLRVAKASKHLRIFYDEGMGV